MTFSEISVPTFLFPFPMRHTTLYVRTVTVQPEPAGQPVIFFERREEWAPLLQRAKFKGFLERVNDNKTGLTGAPMESSAGQPDVERLPAAFDEQTLAKPDSVLSETAQFSGTPPG